MSVRRHILPKDKRIPGDGLVVTRKELESITITDSAGFVFVITVASISGNRCQLHTSAPRDKIKVARTELLKDEV